MRNAARRLGQRISGVFNRITGRNRNRAAASPAAGSLSGST